MISKGRMDEFKLEETKKPSSDLLCGVQEDSSLTDSTEAMDAGESTSHKESSESDCNGPRHKRLVKTRHFVLPKDPKISQGESSTPDTNSPDTKVKKSKRKPFKAFFQRMTSVFKDSTKNIVLEKGTQKRKNDSEDVTSYRSSTIVSFQSSLELSSQDNSTIQDECAEILPANEEIITECEIDHTFNQSNGHDTSETFGESGIPEISPQSSSQATSILPTASKLNKTKTLGTLIQVKPCNVPSPQNELNSTTSAATVSDLRSFKTNSRREDEIGRLVPEEIQTVVKLTEMASGMPSPTTKELNYTASDQLISKLCPLDVDSSEQSGDEGKLIKTKTLGTLIKVKPCNVPSPQSEENSTKSAAAESDLSSFSTKSMCEAETGGFQPEEIKTEFRPISKMALPIKGEHTGQKRNQMDMAVYIYQQLDTIRETMITVIELIFEDLAKHVLLKSSSQVYGTAKDPETVNPSEAYSTTFFPILNDCIERSCCRIRRWWNICFKKKNKVAPMEDLQ
ncbi:uncharacterized protein LOC119772038 [Cyprinodon tularosa]|uniref:uncharacterized protein LOC119772038 n=1 Tax=Cyprinodon tularosa TaxID=77115 RepID=UPI0018E1F562|nr:uncharacterized protein LOC119772038 [Cyprinodon tularosa]